jgi:hypothetical protein
MKGDDMYLSPKNIPDRNKWKEQSMKHEDPHYAVFSNLMLLTTSYAQIPSSATYSYIPLVHILPCQIPTSTPIQNNR